MSKPRKIEGTLVYSPDDVQPEDLLTFIELPDDKRIIRDMIRREREALEQRPYH